MEQFHLYLHTLIIMYKNTHFKCKPCRGDTTSTLVYTDHKHIVFGVIMADFGSSKTIVYASSVEDVGGGIYWDKVCKNRTRSLNLGSIVPGSNNILTKYVRNEGNSAGPLLLETSNWNPSASSVYICLNWNYSNQVLNADKVIPLELTLTVYSTISRITNFSFNTVKTITKR